MDYERLKERSSAPAPAHRMRRTPNAAEAIRPAAERQ